MKPILTAYVSKICLNRFSCRILAFESFSDNLFHYRYIIDISEKAIHLHYIFKSQSNHSKSFFHIVKGTIDLLLYSATYISHAIAQVTKIPGLYNTGMRPLFIDFISLDFTHFLTLHSTFYSKLKPFQPIFVYSLIPILLANRFPASISFSSKG